MAAVHHPGWSLHKLSTFRIPFFLVPPKQHTQKALYEFSREALIRPSSSREESETMLHAFVTRAYFDLFPDTTQMPPSKSNKQWQTAEKRNRKEAHIDFFFPSVQGRLEVVFSMTGSFLARCGRAGKRAGWGSKLHWNSWATHSPTSLFPTVMSLCGNCVTIFMGRFPPYVVLLFFHVRRESISW